MIDLPRSELSNLLTEISKSLDIPDTFFESAEQKYRAVGNWLAADNSPLSHLSPQIYPQGSFQLGTITKPPSDNDEYDLDLVFEVAFSKHRFSQKILKDMVGDRLKEHEIYRKMLNDEGRRCWTLQYTERAHFHLDVLPAVPDTDTYPILEAQGVLSNMAQTSIAITDRTQWNYSLVNPDWLRCNPKGYATWFRQQMIVQFEEQRKLLAKTYKAQMQIVPEYRIKTPLQRCIQLLKRHRDLRFMDTPDIKPASIILTTLAANAYNNEADLTYALVKMVESMPKFIIMKNGISWVENPVDPMENFADRWLENSDREPAVRSWLHQVKSDLNMLLTCTNIEEIKKRLAIMFGETITNNVINQYQILSSNQITRVVVVSSQPIVAIRDPMKPWGGER
jgi:hypothetical protein